MAQHIRDIRITYENGGTFGMEVRLDGADWKTVAEIDENNFFEKIWDTGIAPACKRFFEDEIDGIGSLMKAD